MSTAMTTTGTRPWHAATAADTLTRLSGSRDGLSTEEAARRHGRYGPNDLTRRRGPSVWTVPPTSPAPEPRQRHSTIRTPEPR